MIRLVKGGTPCWDQALHVHTFDDDAQSEEKQATQALLQLHKDTLGLGAPAPHGTRRGAPGQVRTIQSCE